MEHEVSGLELVMGHFKDRACVQKLAVLDEIPTWEKQTFTVRNREWKDELYKYHPLFLPRGGGHHACDSFRISKGRGSL